MGGDLPPSVDWVASQESLSTVLDNIWHSYHERVAPQCISLILRPPRTKQAWDEIYHNLKMSIKQQVLGRLDEIEMTREEYANFRCEVASDAHDMLIALASYKNDYKWRRKDTWRRKKKGASVLVELNDVDQIIGSRPGSLCPHCYPQHG